VFPCSEVAIVEVERTCIALSDRAVEFAAGLEEDGIVNLSQDACEAVAVELALRVQVADALADVGDAAERVLKGVRLRLLLLAPANQPIVGDAVLDRRRTRLALGLIARGRSHVDESLIQRGES